MDGKIYFCYDSMNMHTQTFEQKKPALDEEFVRLLTESHSVSAAKVQTLREHSGQQQEQFERLLLSEGHITQEQCAKLKALAHGWHFVDLTREPISLDLLRLIPRAVSGTQAAVVFRKEGEGVHVALLHPERGSIRRLLQKKFGMSTKFFLATKNALKAVLERYDANFSDRFTDLIAHAEHIQQAEGGVDPVINIVNMILLHALRSNASDIHIEPTQHDALIRERIDGLLHTSAHLPKEVHARTVLRVKVMANLATDEHAVPQDGKLLYKHSDGKNVDVRVSVIPTTRGEKIVLRLLVTSNQTLPLEFLGLQKAERDLLQDEMKRSWGMILVTGPTGSGKTTSLYAVIRQLSSEQVNIATIEDPVEYDLPGANQIQVNEKAGLTFATGLRSIVRQDPNIILVGEIRDHETARIAVNSAMTGHLVLSTLHTNDASTAIPRLIDMGIEPFLISSTVNVVIAQRLVRMICVRCKESMEMDLHTLAQSLPAEIAKKLPAQYGKMRLYHGKGCDLCNGTGFRGRTGIFEILRMDDAIRSMSLKNASADVIRKAAEERGMRTMMDDGLARAIQGVTTLEEVLRVIRS